MKTKFEKLTEELVEQLNISEDYYNENPEQYNGILCYRVEEILQKLVELEATYDGKKIVDYECDAGDYSVVLEKDEEEYNENEYDEDDEEDEEKNYVFLGFVYYSYENKDWVLDKAYEAFKKIKFNVEKDA